MATAAAPSRRERGAAGRPARHTVYVWELPVRIVHWTIVVALIVLSVTGYYIYDPFLGGSGGPGHPGSRWARCASSTRHGGFVFIAAVLFRIYWCFVGNRYAHWRALLPITRRQRRDLRQTLQLLLVPAARSARRERPQPARRPRLRGPVHRVHRHDPHRPRPVRMGHPHARRGRPCSDGPGA